MQLEAAGGVQEFQQVHTEGWMDFTGPTTSSRSSGLDWDGDGEDNDDSGVKDQGDGDDNIAVSVQCSWTRKWPRILASHWPMKASHLQAAVVGSGWFGPGFSSVDFSINSSQQPSGKSNVITDHLLSEQRLPVVE